MNRHVILGYEPLVDEIKGLINKKQFNLVKSINTQTIELYWEIGKEIYI